MLGTTNFQGGDGITVEMATSPSGEGSSSATATQGQGISGQVPAINTIIVRLPTYMREANEGLFEPRVVAIGPYHHGNDTTRDMEAHKERFRDAFFKREDDVNRHRLITACCTEGTLRCYNGDIGEYNVEKLMRDGCFIVELLLQWKKAGNEAHVDDHMRLMSNSIYYDLLLVDNQIPFFVLNGIFNQVPLSHLENIFGDEFKSPDDGNHVELLVDLVVEFFNHADQFSWAYSNPREENKGSRNDNHHHLLDIQYKLVIGKKMGDDNNEPAYNHKSPMPLGIPGANELQDYGVKFCVHENQQTDMFDVTFRGKTMWIPRFEINFGSKILLANLFAYDQIKGKPASKQIVGDGINRQPAGQINNVGLVTSYVVLMNALINTRDDVVVLQREGILDNLLSNEDEVASFFNKLGRCALVDVRKHRYTSMFEDVNRYWRNPLSLCKYLAIFRTKHFRNPWTCLSLVGAILLLTFSCASMIFTILKFYTRGKN